MILQVANPYSNYYLDTSNGNVYSVVHPAHKGELFKLTPNKKGKYNLYASDTKIRSLFTSATLMNKLTTDTFSSTKTNSIVEEKLQHIEPVSERFKRLPDSYKNFVFDTVYKDLYSIKTGNMRLLKPALQRKEDGWQIACTTAYQFITVQKVIELAARGVPYTIESSITFLLTKNRVPVCTALTEYDLQDFASNAIKTSPGEYEIWERKGCMKLIPESIQYVTN